MYSLTKLAKQLHMNKGQLSRLSKRPWFPKRGDSGWGDFEEVRKAIDENTKRRKRRAGVSGVELTDDGLKAALSNLAEKKPLLFFIPAGVSEISIHIKVQ